MHVNFVNASCILFVHASVYSGEWVGRWVGVCANPLSFYECLLHTLKNVCVCVCVCVYVRVCKRCKYALISLRPLLH